MDMLFCVQQACTHIRAHTRARAHTHTHDSATATPKTRFRCCDGLCCFCSEAPALFRCEKDSRYLVIKIAGKLTVIKDSGHTHVVIQIAGTLTL